MVCLSSPGSQPPAPETPTHTFKARKMGSDRYDARMSDTSTQNTPSASSGKPSGDPLVGIIMGSTSDWPTMQLAAEALDVLGVSYEKEVVSAHRTPDKLVAYAKSAEHRGLKVIIAGAGGAAHLPGMVAAMTIVPVLGVPVKSKALSGMDSLLSIVQMPGGVPVGTLAIGDAGARNAGLLAAQIVANEDAAVRVKLHGFRKNQTDTVMAAELE